MDFPILGISTVMVMPAPPADTSSCGRGTLEVHLVTSDQEPVAERVWAVAAVKVMPVLPPQSPLKPVMALRSTALVAVLSIKSALAVPVQFVAVMVTGLPKIEDCTSSLLVAELPIMAKVVQVMVVPLVKVTLSVLVAVPLRVRTAQVKDPETVLEVPFRLMLL